MRKTIRNTMVSLAALAGVALAPSTALAATSYCLPPSNASQTAIQAANSTAATLDGFTTVSLSSLAAFSAPVSGSGLGFLGDTVTAQSGFQYIVVGVGVDLFRSPSCGTISILLTSQGKAYLKGIKKGQTATFSVTTVFLGAGIGIAQRGATEAY
jgi:hypothetical protein